MDPRDAAEHPGVARPGDDPSWAWMHTGQVVRPYGWHVFGVRVPINEEKFGSIIIPEQFRDDFAFGKAKGVRPWQLMQVLAIGPKAKSTVLEPGCYVIVDPWNVNLRKIDDVTYFFPSEKAIIMRIPYEGD